MKPVHLVVLWHMHQPQYRDPESSRYVLPWTRLHALKDYWGIVDMMREFPKFHATFNVVPALGLQLEEYASGNFNEPWFSLAFKNADELTREDKAEILARAFQVNLERLMSRWPRFVELHEWSRPAGGAQALVSFTPRDWRDLQLLSQLAWMEESWLQKDEVVSKLSTKGKDFSEKDKTALKEKQFELLRMVLPAYREAAQRGQIEISTTPFYHPILPRSPPIRSDRICLQPHGCDIRRRGFARTLAPSWGKRPECAAIDNLSFSGWRKCLGILSGEWTRISARILWAHSGRPGFSRAHRERSRYRSGRNSNHQRNFSSLVDQR